SQPGGRLRRGSLLAEVVECPTCQTSRVGVGAVLGVDERPVWLLLRREPRARPGERGLDLGVCRGQGRELDDHEGGGVRALLSGLVARLAGLLRRSLVLGEVEAEESGFALL